MSTLEMEETTSQAQKAPSEVIFYVLPGASLLGVYVMMNLFSPLSVGPVGILGIFILVYIFFLSLFFLAIRSFYFLIDQVSDSRVRLISKRKTYYLSSVVAFAPVFLLALNSIGQLQLGDFILVLLFVALACFYVSRRTS